MKTNLVYLTNLKKRVNLSYLYLYQNYQLKVYQLKKLKKVEKTKTEISKNMLTAIIVFSYGETIFLQREPNLLEKSDQQFLTVH